MKHCKFLAVAIGLIVTMGAGTHADDSSGDGVLREVGILSGYSWANLKRQADYEMIPVVIRFSLNLNPVAEKIGLAGIGDWTFNVEPYFSQVTSPSNAQETGCGLLIRWTHSLLSSNLALYAEGGAGPMYMTLDTEEQSTHFNFIDQIGCGCRYALNEQWRMELGYRFWHKSNAGIDHPNNGIEGHTVLWGLMRRL